MGAVNIPGELHVRIYFRTLCTSLHWVQAPPMEKVSVGPTKRRRKYETLHDRPHARGYVPGTYPLSLYGTYAFSNENMEDL